MTLSARWLQLFSIQLQRRQHIILHGNIHDQFLWRGDYIGLTDYFNAYFSQQNCDLIVHYDPIDGFEFADPEMMQRFNQLIQPEPQPDPEPDVPVAPTELPPRRAPGEIVQQQHPELQLQRNPDEAFAQLRIAIRQDQQSLVSIINLSDLLTGDRERFTPDERNLLAQLQKCTLEASIMRQGDLTGYRNTLILLASDLNRVPDWFYNNNPYISLVQVTRPSKNERLFFIERFGDRFYGGEALSNNLHNQPNLIATISEDFADLTEDFRTLELETLRHTSFQARLPITNPRRLIDFYKFGKREEPFEQINREKIAQAEAEISTTVVGQPRAVEAVTTMLMSAKVGITINQVGGRSSKPKGVFFFVGPTGVGKTELAKSLTRLIFGDEQAFQRFDMSEYKEEHAAEKLAGAPPGFVGYDEGGQLTNCVMERPYSILLFDEIEKAHPRVLDKFLQILEDGRLTDGKGQTAYFNQTVIIFTSNIGASDLSDPQTGAVLRSGIMDKVQTEGAESFSYPQVKDHFDEAVKLYFSRIERAELFGRLEGKIVVFDLLRPQFVSQIAHKFLTQLADSALDKHQLRLSYENSIFSITQRCMTQGDNLLFGGRRLRTLLENLVERPLNRWIFETYADLSQLSGQHLNLALDDNAQLIVTR